MFGKIADLFVNIGAKTDDFKKGSNSVKSEAEKLGYSIDNLKKTIIGAFAADAVMRFASETMQLAGIAEGVQVAFKRIGNENTLEGLRKATKGTVSDLELMKSAIQSQNFGIPLQQMGSLLAFAHQRAKDTGQSVDYLVNSIVMGIGRKSPLILDNLGISAIALKEKMKGVEIGTASVGDVAKAVGEIASESMKNIKDSAMTAAEKTAQLNTQMENLKVTIGTKLNKALEPFKQFLIDLVTILNEDSLAVREANQFMDDFLKRTGYEALNAVDKLKAVEEQLTAQNEALAYQTNELTDLKERQTKAYVDNDIKEFKRLGKKIEYQKRYIESNGLYIKQLEDIKKRITDIAEVDPTGGDGKDSVLGLLEAAKKKIEDLKKSIEQATTTTFAAQLSNDLIKAEADLLRLQKAIRDQSQGELVGKGLKPMTSKGSEGVSTTGLGLDEQLSNKMSTFADSYVQKSKEIIDANDRISLSMADFATSFAEGLGSVIAGTDSLGNVLLQAMTGFMSTLGQQMIAVGFAKTVLDKLILTPGGGALAIGAGVALVALAGAARATMASGVGGGGSSSGGGGSNYSTSGSQSLTVEIVGVTKGQDIHWSQKNYTNKLNSVS